MTISGQCVEIVPSASLFSIIHYKHCSVYLWWMGMISEDKISVFDNSSGEFDFGDWRCRHCRGLRGAEAATHRPCQPACASPLGWGHHGAADECSTHSSHRHVSITQAGLWIASGGGQCICSFAMVSVHLVRKSEKQLCFHIKCKKSKSENVTVICRYLCICFFLLGQLFQLEIIPML